MTMTTTENLPGLRQPTIEGRSAGIALEKLQSGPNWEMMAAHKDDDDIPIWKSTNARKKRNEELDAGMEQIRSRPE
jgi:hypothetical protein